MLHNVSILSQEVVRATRLSPQYRETLAHNSITGQTRTLPKQTKAFNSTQPTPTFLLQLASHCT